MVPNAVVYVDSSLIVLNKPAGLLSVPGKGPDKQDCLSARVRAQYADALVVHRLDMATSGLLVMARGPAMQRALSDAFAQRSVHKRYEAVVSGCVAAEPGAWQTIDLPIAADWPNRPLRVVDPVNGQPSLTRYQVVLGQASAKAPYRTTRLLLEPVTGRTHQLRVHLRAIGHPILGDALYAEPSVLSQSNRLLLHACALAFAHPATGEAMQFACPADF